MSPSLAPALEQALAARQSPGLFVRFRDRPLPQDIALLLRIAANETEACEQACASSGEPRRIVVEAAVLYIQQVMFHPESNSYRVFGVDVDALEGKIREHRRWLLRWLHPDRSSDSWNGVYVNRVTLAWQDLRSAERRAEYDARMAPRMRAEYAGRQALVLRQDHRLGRYPDEVLFSARATRRLPILLLGALAIGSISVLALEFYLNRMDGAEGLAVDAAAAARPVVERPGPIESIEAVPAIASAPPVAMLDAGQSTASPPVETRPRGEAVASSAAAPIPMAAPKPPPTPVAPTAPAAPPLDTRAAQIAPIAPIAPIGIDDKLVDELVTQFRRAYASGKLEQVRVLLAEQAPGAESEQRLTLDAYQRLFESSRSRGIDIRNVSWFAQGDMAVLIGSYEAWIELRGARKRRREAGEIRFDLRREGGSLRIARLRHAAQDS